MVRVLCVSLIPNAGGVSAALTILGFHVYDLRAALRAPNHPSQWAQILSGQGQPFHLKMLSNGFDAAAGPPTSTHWEPILKACPEYTKVILVEIEEKKELENFAKRHEAYFNPLMAAVAKLGRSKTGQAYHAFFTNLWPAGFRKDAVQGHLDFLEEVKQKVPRDRLLVFNPTRSNPDGWRELCDFLNLPLPGATPFPSYEDGSEAMQALVKRLTNAGKILRLLLWMLGAMAFSLLLPVLWKAGKGLPEQVQELRRDYEESFSKKKLEEEEEVGKEESPLVKG